LNLTPRRPWLEIVGASLTGIAVLLSFPGYGYEVGLDGLIWVALVPLFLAAAGAGVKRGLVLGWCSGLILEAAGFCWILFAIRSFTGFPAPVSTLLFGGWLLYASIPWALLGLVLGACRRKQILWVIPAWVAIEGLFPRLFPWHLGGAFYGRAWLLQCADLLGASGLTALVLAVNVLGFRLILTVRRQAGRPYALGAVVACLIGSALIYGRARLAQVERLESEAPRLAVLCVQGAIDPRSREQSLETYLARTSELLREGPTPDLIVWPEGADQYLFDLTGGRDPLHIHRSKAPGVDFAPVLVAPLIAGGFAGVAERAPVYSNVSFYLEAGQLPRFYEKNRRLLFGEQIPFVDYLPESWRESIYNSLEHAGTIAAGTERPIFHRKGLAFRCLICYEAVLPDYMTECSSSVDFLVNITEDMWYGRTAHIPQHVSVLVLRVVENRTPLVRAANAGPSGVIDITGRFQRGNRIFEPEGVRAELRARRLPTLYQSFGRYLPHACALLLAGLLLARLRPRHRGNGREKVVR